MPSHIKMALTRTAEVIPFVNSRLCLGAGKVSSSGSTVTTATNAVLCSASRGIILLNSCQAVGGDFLDLLLLDGADVAVVHIGVEIGTFDDDVVFALNYTAVLKVSFALRGASSHIL